MVNFLLGKFVGVQLGRSPNFQKISRNINWLLFGNAFRLGVGFFVTAWVARYLGPEQFGILSYAMALVSIFIFLGSLGLNEILIRDFVQDVANIKEMLATAFLMKVFGGIVTFAVAVLLAFILNPTDTKTHWLVGVIAGGTILQAFDVFEFYFQSQLQSKYAVSARNVACFLITVVKIYLILFKAPVIAFAWVILGEAILGGFFLLFAYRAQPLSFHLLNSSFAMARRLIKDSWPIFLSGIATMIYLRIDQIMLHYFIGDGEVGIYAAAIKVVEFWGVLGIVFMSSVFPVIFGFKKTDEKLYWKKIRQIYRFLIFASIVISLVMIMTAKPIMLLLFGASFQRAANVLSIYILAIVFMYLRGATTYVLVSERLQRYEVYRSVIACLINIVLNFTLIPRFGILGAAIAAIFSHSIPIFALGWFKETRGIMRIREF